MSLSNDSNHTPSADEPMVPAPYVSAQREIMEVSIKSVAAGIVLGIVFGAANAYLGLQVGLTISTSIPVAVMAVAFFRTLRAFGASATILEANTSQTIGSASSSIASGVIFTLPALFLWGMDPSLLQMTLLAMCGGLLGVLFMIPLRRYLIARQHNELPYPEGTACASVLIASEVGGSQAMNVFYGLGAGAILKVILGALHLIKDKVEIAITPIKGAALGLNVSPALFGVGYILGPRIASVMVGGGLLSSLLIIPAICYWGADRTTPLYPETVQLIADMKPSTIWNRYVRYIGAGAVATAGILTLIRSIPTMIESFRIGAGQLRRRVEEQDAIITRTDRDLSLRLVGMGVLATVIVLAVVPQAFGTIDSLAMRSVAAILIAVFAFFFVTVSSRIVGLVGVTSNPTSGMTIASLMGTATIFLALGWTDLTGKAAALCVGCVVAIAASIAGDTSQDLKTGFLVGATPRRQQLGELVGVLTAAMFVCYTVKTLDAQPGGGFGSEVLPAPQATLMKLVIDGVLEQRLPWVLVGIGAGIAVLATLVRVPALPFAVGVYLPVATMLPVFVGGMLRWWLGRSARSDDEREQRKDRGVLLGSGLVGGEGLVGVGIAAAAIRLGHSPKGFGYKWAENLFSGADWIDGALVTSLVTFALMVWMFAWACKRNSKA